MKLFNKFILFITFFTAITFASNNNSNLFVISAYSPLITSTKGGTVEGIASNYFDAAGPVYNKGYETLTKAYDNNIGFIFTITGHRNVTNYGAIGSKINHTDLQNATMPEINAWVADVVTQIQNAVADPVSNATIIAWNISPEELRYWVWQETNYLQRVHDAVSANDPSNRPTMMYEPNHRTASNLAKTVLYQDILPQGCYAHLKGFDHNRVFIRHQMSNMTEAIAITGVDATPVPVLEMVENTDHPYSEEDIPLIPSFVKHDVYCALANGAHGFLIWSMGNRAGFTTAAYTNYYSTYTKASKELHDLGLRDVFTFGKDVHSAMIDITSGATNLQLIYNDKTNYYPSISLRELNYNGKRYIVMVNSSEEQVDLRLNGLFEGASYKDLLGNSSYNYLTTNYLDLSLAAREPVILLEYNEFVWTNALGGAWDIAGNWTPANNYPTAEDSAILTNVALSSTSAVTISLPPSGASAGKIYLAKPVCRYQIGDTSSRTFRFDNGENNSLLNLDREISEWTPAMLFSSSTTVEVNNTLEINLADNYKQVLRFSGAIAGTGTIIRTGEGGANSGFVNINAVNPFSGNYIAQAGRTTFALSNPFPNAKLVRFDTSSKIRLPENSSLDLTLNGGGIEYNTSFQTNFLSGNLTITANSTVHLLNNRTLILQNDVSGNARLYIDDSATAVSCFGSISPGTNSIGTLTLDEGPGTLNIGQLSDKVTLNIEIYSNDFDKLIVENLDSSLNLSNINLNFSILQIPDPSKTNIIITLINGNDFTGYFDSTTWQIGFTGNVFIEGNDVKVTGVIPEPSVFLIYSLLIIFRLTLFYKK
ncbi:MAG: hypothetical protein DRI44_02390 [Chlamydiae bacterium]|nr:MAG: hypothetical protein DRI44_02390 [Chlamydiota bacterium]